MKRRVLILCTGNSARSQMAESLLRMMQEIASRLKPAVSKASSVRPEAIQAMREIGIDISNHRSKHLDELAVDHFDCVLTALDNANESYPIFPGLTKRVHQSFYDPPPPCLGSEEERLSASRRVRDDLCSYL